VGRYGSLFQVRFSGPPAQDGESPGLETPARGSAQGWALAGLLWLLGVACLTIRHVAGILSIRKTLEASEPCQDRRLLHLAACIGDAVGTAPVELLLSATSRIPFEVGIARPRIILPGAATGWSDERLASTLLHEHMHIRRCDILVAEALRALASLAWCSPLPWLALSQALRLREEACDQAVLRKGARPADYAANLLAAARSLSSPPRLPAAVGLSGHSHLEQRIRGVLEAPTIPSPQNLLRRIASAAVLGATALGTALLTTPLHAFLDSAAQARRDSGSIAWLAVLDPQTRGGRASGQGTFTVAQEGGYAHILLSLAGQRSMHRLPIVAQPEALPLTGRARMILPFGSLVDGHSARPFINPGWTIWDDRRIPVRTAASGRVSLLQVDAQEGIAVEIDHGSGLRTRYGLGRHGSSLVREGEFVAAGEPLGSFGEIAPNDIPSLAFAIFIETPEGRVFLDPAPFLFKSDPNRETALATSVLNASVRIGDRTQVRRLLAAGLSPNRVSADGTLPLEWAILARDLATAKDLLTAGADPQAPTWNTRQAHIALHGPTVAELARETGDAELMALLTPE